MKIRTNKINFSLNTEKILSLCHRDIFKNRTKSAGQKDRIPEV